MAEHDLVDTRPSTQWATTFRGALVQFLVMSMLVTLLVFHTDQQPVGARPAIPESPAVPETAASLAALVESRGVPDDAPIRFAGATGTLMPAPGSGYGRTSQLVTGDLNGDSIDDVVVTRDIFHTGRTVVAIGLGEGDGTLSEPTYLDLDTTLSVNERGGLALGDVDGDLSLDIVVGVRNPVLTRVFLNDGSGGFADETGRVIDVITESPRSILAEDVDGDATVDLLVTEDGTSGSRLRLYRNLGGGAFDLGTTLFESADTLRAVDLGDLTDDGLADVVVADSRSTVNVLVQRAVDAEPVNNVFDDDGPEEGLNGGNGMQYDAVYVWITPDLTGDGLADVVLVSRHDRGCAVDAEGCLIVAGGDGSGALSNPAPVDEDEDGVDDNNRTHPLRSVWWQLDHPATPPAPADLDDDGLLEFVVFGATPHVEVVEIDPSGPITSTRLTTGNGTPPDHVQSATINGASNNDALYVGDTGILDLDLDGRLDIVVGQLLGSYSDLTPDVTWLRNDPSYPWGFATGVTVDEIRAPIDDRRSTEDSVLADWSGDGELDLVTFSSSLDLLLAAGNGDGTFQPATVAAEDPTAAFPGCRSGLNSDIVDGIHAADFDGDGATDIAYVSNDDSVHHLCVISGDGGGGVDAVSAIVGVGTDTTTTQQAAWTDYEGDDDVDLLLAELDAGDGTVQLYRNDGATGFSRVEVLRLEAAAVPVFAAGDVDGDDRADLVYRTGSAGEDVLHSHLQQPGGALAATSVESSPLPESAFIAIGELAIGDFDGDGDGDLVYNHQGNQLAGRGMHSYLATSNGDGTFTVPETTVNEVNLSNHNTDYRLVDIEGDGDLDIVTVSYGVGVEVLVNTGEGAIHTGDRFDGPFRYSTGHVSPTQLLLGDLDGDGDLDAVSEDDPFSKQPYDDYVVLLQIPGTPPIGGGGDVDLTVGAITPDPASLMAGEGLAVEYTVTNEGADAAVGPWTDAVYLSGDGTWDVNDRLLGTVERAEPVLAGGSYTETVDAIAHPAVAGENQIIVRTDARNVVSELDEEDNEATTPVDVVVPVIEGSLDVIVGPGGVAYAQVPVGEAEQLLLTVSGPAGGATVDVVRDAIPVPRRQLQVPDRSETVRRLGLPAGDAGTWFVRLAGDASLEGDSTYTLDVASLDFGIVSIEPDIVADNGPATVVLRGAGFTDATVVTLEGPGSVEAEIATASDDGRSLAATFDWGPLSDSEFDVPIGLYDVVVTDGEDTDTLTDGLRVIEAESPAPAETRAGRVNPCFLTGEAGGTFEEECAVFEWVANVPGELRRLAGTAGTPGYFLYQNRARIDIPRPFVEIYNKGVEISTDGGVTWTQGGFEVPVPNLGAADDVLPAGISGRIDFRIRSTDAELDDGVELELDYQVGHQVYAPFDYSSLAADGVGEFERIFGAGEPETKAVADLYLDRLEGPGQDLEYWTPEDYGRAFIDGYPIKCPEVIASSGGRKGGIRCIDLRPAAHFAARALRSTTQHDYLLAAHDEIASARVAGYDGPFTRAFAEGLFRARALATAPGAPISGEVAADDAPLPMPPVLARVDRDDDRVDYVAGYGWIDGSYNIWEVPRGEDVEIWVDGYLSDPAATVVVPAEGTDVVDLAVTVGNTISGTVSIDGVPVAGALVSTTTDSGAERRNLTDEDGAYQLTGLETGERDVVVEHERAVGETRLVVVAEGDNDEEFDLVGLTSLIGTVGTSGGAGIAGASVRLVPADAPEGIAVEEQSGEHVATTGADGTYAMHGVEPGDFVVVASAPGYVDGAEPVVATGPSVAVDIALDPAAALSGVVTDAGGVPASGAAVFVETVDQEEVLGETLTEGDGTFRIDGVPAGEIVVTALGRRGSDVATTSLTAEASGTHELDLSFPAVGNVSVLVTDVGGDPVAGARVEIVGGAPGERLLETNNTGTDGRLVIEDVLVDGSTVVVGGVVREPVPTGHDGTEPMEIVIDVATVGGRLLDAGSEPIDDVEVLLLRNGESVATTFTSETGDFEFHVTNAGDYEVLADPADGLRRQEVAVTPGTDVDLGTLTPGPHSIALTMNLDDGDEVEVLGYHEVEIPLPGVSDPRLILRRFLSEEDPATFAGLPIGLYRVVARNAARFIDETVEVDGDESLSIGDTDAGRILGTLTDSDGEPVATARIDALSPGLAPVVDFSADDGTYSTGLAPGTYDLLIRAPELGEAIRVDGVVVEEGVDLVVDAQLSAAAADIDVSLDSVGFLEAGAHVSLRDVATDLHFEAFRGASTFRALPPGDYQVEVRVDGHLPSFEPATVGTEDVEIAGSVGTPVALAPGYDFGAEVGAEARVTGIVGDDRAVAAAVADPPSVTSFDRIGGPVEALGIGDAIDGGLGFAVDYVQTGAGTAIETIKQKLTVDEPQRDPREAELRERLEHLKRKLDVRRTRNISACRSTISSQKAAITWDERKEQFFQAWVDRYDDLDRVILDVVFRTGLTMLSAAIAAVSILAAVILLAPLAVEGGIVFTALSAIEAALGTTVIGSFTFAQLSAALSFILGLIPAVFDGVDELIRDAESLDTTALLKRFLFSITALIDKLFSIAFLPLSLFGFNPSPFEMSAGFLALGTALNGESKKYLAAQDEIDDLIDQANSVDEELKALAKQKSEVQFQLKRKEKLLRSNQGYVRMTKYDRGAIEKVEKIAKERNALRAELDRLNKIPDANPHAERIAQLRNNRSGFAVVGEFLGAFGGAVLDVVSYFQALENQLAALRALDEQLLNGSDRYDAAERAYKNAIDNSKLEVERSVTSLLRPDCVDPIDPEDWDDVIDGYYIRPKDPNEIVGPLGGGDEHALKATPPSLDYVVFFENLGPGSEEIPDGEEIAEVSAARVTIETELDADVDPDTVTLGDVQIGEIVIDVPDGLSAYEGVHGPYPDPGGEAGDIQIRVEGSVVDGTIRWVLTALEPGTGFVVGDLRGLLPPEDGSGLGKGSVGYSVAPGMGAGNGTVVTAQASIVFDDNEAIVTNTWSNVLDDDTPEAMLVGTPATGDLPFDLTWESSDPTSSVAEVDVYIRYDGDWLRIKRVVGADSTTITSGDLTFGFDPEAVELPEDAELVADDSEVDFAVVAIDAAGNSELAPPQESEASVLLGTGFDAGPSPDPDPDPDPGPGPGPDPEPDPEAGPVDVSECDPAAPPPFPDTIGSVHAATIGCLASLGVLDGFADGSFGPGQNMTRGQFASVLVRALRDRGVLPDDAPDAFTDDDGSVHEASLDLLAAIGVTEGYGDGTVGPNDPVTRGQAVSLLMRAWSLAGLDAGSDVPDAFTDDDGSVHEGALNAAAALGLVNGYGDGTVGPGDPVTRGQIASLVFRSLERIPA